MTSREIQSWLEVDLDGLIHAGEYLRAVLHIKSTVDVQLLLATVQLVGVLTTADRYILPGPLLELEKSPRFGGGSNLASPTRIRGDDVHKVWPVFTSTPTVIVAAEQLFELVEYSYEWILFIPNNAAPSYEGQAANIKYQILVTTQFGDRGSINLEIPLKVLPHFRTKPSKEHHLIPVPFQFIDFTQPVLRTKDCGYTCRIHPGIKNENVWDRYKKGIVPKIGDFRKFPRHPLKDRLPRADPPPSQAGMFNAIALDSSSKVFALRSEDQLVAEVKLSKTLLRLGEEMICIITFPQDGLNVFQLSASITATEIVADEFSRNAGSISFRKVYRRHEMACWMHQQLSFSLSLPSDANPTFYSSLLQHQWNIELSFLCGPKHDTGATLDSPSMSQLSTPTGDIKNAIECVFPLWVLPSLAVQLALRQYDKMHKVQTLAL